MVDSNSTPILEISPAQAAKPTYDFTYEWKVTGMKARGATVVQTYWDLTATDASGHFATFNGATPFTPAEVPSSDFVALESLTQERVISWIKDYVDNHHGYWDHINEKLAAGMADIHSPITAVNIPTA
jgi:hypothetical protein